MPACAAARPSARPSSAGRAVRDAPGDIRPADAASALTADGIVPLSWGFELPDRRLVINARSKSAWEKPLFREAMKRRRCILPAAWFYEWDRQKRRNAFHPAGCGILYLAGLFNLAGRFVILTTNADAVMRPVHRMPVCLPEDGIRLWRADAAAARRTACNPGVELRREKPVEQALLLNGRSA